jgi:peptidoglycan/LPS O-acetylase OafA/YrhL
MRMPETTTNEASRLPFVDALRALAATLITWHHIGIYGPLAYIDTPDTDLLLVWADDFRWAVQIFLVVGGYVAARSMVGRSWHARHMAGFVARRYCRLGVPYLASLAIAVVACAWARGWIPDEVVGPVPQWDQVLAHALLLQDILGYESLAPGVWFVSIEFQLGLIFVALLSARDVLSARVGERIAAGFALGAGWTLAALSLFIFNLDDTWDMWAIYFWGPFFLGAVIYLALRNSASTPLFSLDAMMMVIALAYFWRWRLVVALATGLVLYWSGRLGLMQRWPASRLIGNLGRTSYSLFLIHFPVLVVTSALWVRLGGVSEASALAASLVAYLASLVAAEAFYRAVEVPSLRWSRRFA